MSTVDADSCESKIIVREILHSARSERRDALNNIPQSAHMYSVRFEYPIIMDHIRNTNVHEFIIFALGTCTCTWY